MLTFLVVPPVSRGILCASWTFCRLAGYKVKKITVLVDFLLFKHHAPALLTRMHSSRMRTDRLLTVDLLQQRGGALRGVVDRITPVYTITFAASLRNAVGKHFTDTYLPSKPMENDKFNKYVSIYLHLLPVKLHVEPLRAVCTWFYFSFILLHESLFIFILGNVYNFFQTSWQTFSVQCTKGAHTDKVPKNNNLFS